MDFSNITSLLSEGNIKEASEILKKEMIKKITEDEIDGEEGISSDENGPTFGAKSVNPTGDNPTFKSNGAGGRANQQGGPAYGGDWINTGKATENLPPINFKIPSGGQRLRDSRFDIEVNNLIPGNKELNSEFRKDFLPAMKQLYSYDYAQIALNASGEKDEAKAYLSARNSLGRKIKENIIGFLKDNGYSEDQIKSYGKTINNLAASYLAQGQQIKQIARNFTNGKGAGSQKSTSVNQDYPVASRSVK